MALVNKICFSSIWVLLFPFIGFCLIYAKKINFASICEKKV